MKNVKLIIIFFSISQISAVAQNSIEVNKKVAKYFMEEAMGTTQHVAVHTPDFIAHAGNKSYNLTEEYAAAIENLKAFPDMSVNVTRMIAEEDMVVVHWKATGTNTGANSYIPVATNKRGEVEGITIFRMENGKIAEEWGLTDFISTLLKWGVIGG